MQHVLSNQWARWLVPSLCDLFFLAILGWTFLGGPYGWQGLLADGDAGWHIRTGEYILDHHAVPRQDLYSFSKPGAPWYAWEWLTDVIDASLFRMSGLKGVVLLAGLVIAAFVVSLLLRMIWRGAHPLIAIATALIGYGAASVHFLARPHVFTLLLLSISVWMVDRDRDAPTRRIWLLVPLTVLWTNLHGGFLSLIAILGLTAMGSAVEAWLGPRTWKTSLRYAALMAACFAASFVNPYGYRLHQHVAEYLRSDWIRNVVQEFQSPIFRGEAMLQFEALLLVGVMVAGALFRRRRVVHGLWILYFAHMALGSGRHVPLFVCVAAPLVAVQVSEWYLALTANARKSSLLGILNQVAADSAAGFERTSVWPFATVAALILIGNPIKWPTDFPEQMFPVRMAHAHAAQILDSRVLTTDQWGDYLIFMNPRQKVFIDGRSDFYGPEIGQQYLRMTNGTWDWAALMAKNNFNLVLLPIESPLVQLLKRDPGWRIVEDDGARILLARR